MATAQSRPMPRRRVHDRRQEPQSRGIPTPLIVTVFMLIPVIAAGVIILINSGKSDADGSTRLGGPGADKGAFDPRSLDLTVLWLRQDVVVPAAQAAKALVAVQNDSALKEKGPQIIQTAQAKLAPCIGKTVRWAFAVGQVTEQTITVYRHDTYSSSRGEGPVEIIWPGWDDLRNQAQFTIGESITAEHARRLHSGGYVFIEGTIEDITLPNVFNKYSRVNDPTTIKLTNVRIVAQ